MSARRYYAKRLQILGLMMRLENENNYFKFRGNKITMDDLNVRYLDNIAREYIESLNYRKNFLRLQINYNRSHKINMKHRFYAGEREIEKLREELFDAEDRIKEVDKMQINPDDIDFSKLTVLEFVDKNCEKIYEKLFESNKMSKKMSS